MPRTTSTRTRHAQAAPASRSPMSPKPPRPRQRSRAAGERGSAGSKPTPPAAMWPPSSSKERRMQDTLTLDNPVARGAGYAYGELCDQAEQAANEQAREEERDNAAATPACAAIRAITTVDFTPGACRMLLAALASKVAHGYWSHLEGGEIATDALDGLCDEMEAMQ